MMWSWKEVSDEIVGGKLTMKGQLHLIGSPKATSANLEFMPNNFKLVASKAITLKVWIQQPSVRTEFADSIVVCGAERHRWIPPGKIEEGHFVAVENTTVI